MAELTFSIVIPVYNDVRIIDCLNSILSLNYDTSKIEVIVVDNNSTSHSPHTIIELLQPFQHKLQLRTIREPKPGSYKSRNTGIRIAEGTYIALTDSDCVVDSQWLKEAEKSFQDETIMGVMGFSAGDNKNVIARYEQKMYEEIIGQFTEISKPIRRIDTRNFIMRRELFEQLNGFNDNLRYGGDMEFGARAHAHGNVLSYNQRQIVTHTNPTKFLRLLSKRITQNEGNMHILRFHDTKFIEEYFPSLLRYSPDLSASMKRIAWRLLMYVGFPCVPLLYILPSWIGFYMYKAYTVMAVRLGQLNYLHKTS